MIESMFIIFLVLAIFLIIVSAFSSNPYFVIICAVLSLGFASIILPPSLHGVDVITGKQTITNSTTNTTIVNYTFSKEGGSSWLFLIVIVIMIIDVYILIQAVL